MKTRKLAASVASAMMLTTMVIAPLTAGAGNYPEEKQAQGTTTTFDKYLVMDSDATVPNVTSVFSITAGEGIATGVNSINCYAGIGTPTFNPDETQGIAVVDGKAVVSFSATDTTTPEKDVNTKTVAFRTTDNDSDEKFATKTVTVNFAEIKFPEPGLYRYIITEEAPTDGGISVPTGDREYTLFVTVKDDNGTLVVSQTEYVLQEGTDTPSIIDKVIKDDSDTVIGTTKVNENKKTGMTNWYTTHDLMFNKNVTGNQGSRDKYFKFTVKLTNTSEEGVLTMTDARANDRFIVTGSFDVNPEKNDATKTDYTSVPDGESLNAMQKANGYGEGKELNQMSIGTTTYCYVTYAQLVEGKDFYLHSGQNIEINGIPEGLGYIVSEEKEDYTSNVTVNNTDGLDADGVKNSDNSQVTDSRLTGTARLTFTNSKDGTIPTGVLTTVAASVGIVAIGLAGIIFGIVNNRKKSEEE